MFIYLCPENAFKNNIWSILHYLKWLLIFKLKQKISFVGNWLAA